MILVVFRQFYLYSALGHLWRFINNNYYYYYYYL